MIEQAESISPISLCSLNINQSNTATHAAMYIISKNVEPVFDIFLVQEPWWEKVNQEYRTVVFPGWQTILLRHPILSTEHPRVVTYYKLDANLEITLCNDFITDLDVMTLDIKREGVMTEAMRVINIYNQKELGANPTTIYTSNHIANLQWDPSIPTIITSNWNICHPQWDSRVTSACPRTCETLEWLDRNGFTLCNEPFVPTREDPMGHSSVINLTFKNPVANGGNILKKIYIDTSISSLLDHHAVILQVGKPGRTVTNPTTNQLNWKHADKEGFKKTLRQLIEDNRVEYEQIESEYLNPEKQTATPDKLDRAMEFIQQLLENTANKAVPACRICSKSKPWWTPELSKAYTDLREA